MRPLRALCLLLLLRPGTAAALPAPCPAGNWLNLSPENIPRQESAVAGLDGRVYAVGGLAGRSNATEIYDIASDTWTSGPDFPVETDHGWAVALDGRIYVGGGSGNRVFTTAPGAAGWTEVASSRYVHGGTPAAGVIEGRIYVAGGTGGEMTGNEAEVYDPAGNTWATVASMACARNHTAGGVIDGKLYVAGGRPGSQDCVEAYDPLANTWIRRAPMPTARSGVAGAVVGHCLYVFGGEGNAADVHGIFHQVEAYDPKADAWTSLPPMRTGRHGIVAAVIGRAVYLPGGATREGLGVTGINEVYVVEEPPDPTARPPVAPPRGRGRRAPLPPLPPR
ncbi:MAG: galactose oxidase [Acidobacteriota bacterium]|nr:galactose oxidase [Acidobacteriota bacterium]